MTSDPTMVSVSDTWERTHLEDIEQRTALDLAAEEGQVAVVESLLEKAENKNLPKPSTVRKAAATGFL